MTLRLQITERLDDRPDDGLDTPTPRVSRRPAPRAVPAVGGTSPRRHSLIPPDAADDPATAERDRALRGLVKSARELAREQARDRPVEDELFPTALPALDRLLDGGLARGRLVELVGRRSSGRFSLAVAAVAAATASGEAAALVDLGDGLDPRAAAAAGADLDRLLWLRPRHVKEAVGAAEMLLATGFPLVVVELGLPPVPGGRGAQGAWLRLARSAEAHRSALLVSSPYRVSGPAAAVVVTARGATGDWRDAAGALHRRRTPAAPLLAGLDARLVLDKARGHQPGEREEVRLRVAEAPPEAPPAPVPDAERSREAERGSRATRERPETWREVAAGGRR